jgi:hypothetical protein
VFSACSKDIILSFPGASVYTATNNVELTPLTSQKKGEKGKDVEARRRLSDEQTGRICLGLSTFKISYNDQGYIKITVIKDASN